MVFIQRLIDCTRARRHFNSSGQIMAVGDAFVFPDFLTPVLTQLSFQSHRLLFSQMLQSREVKIRRKESLPQSGIELTTTRSSITHRIYILTLSLTSPGFLRVSCKETLKHCGKRRNCSLPAISPFPTVFSTRLENILPFYSNLKLSSANSFILE